MAFTTRRIDNFFLLSCMYNYCLIQSSFCAVVEMNQKIATYTLWLFYFTAHTSIIYCNIWSRSTLGGIELTVPDVPVTEVKSNKGSTTSPPCNRPIDSANMGVINQTSHKDCNLVILKSTQKIRKSIPLFLKAKDLARWNWQKRTRYKWILIG